MAWLRRIDKGNLHPGLVAVIERVLRKLEEDFKSPFKAYSGLRTFAEQNELYAQGRTKGKKGKIVTKARGGQSMHNYGLAVDMAPFNLLTEEPDDLWWPDPDELQGEIWWKVEEALMESAIELDEAEPDGIDYEWGGRWKFRDVPHCQVRFTFNELHAGMYPYCTDVEWLVKAHTTFLFNTPWMKRRVQHLLNMQSYNAGVVDGMWGKQTASAVMSFVSDQNLSLRRGSFYDQNLVERLVRLHQTGMSLERGVLPEDLCA